ncbi:MAG: glutamate racemase [Actinobacteria bacterium]|uniref:glutamate racemase n=1 Tax=freshwater metagenome TaxID=449393 RepID=A0A6J7PG96_9ZZZZ|nr:glutamate racemase [Actinomycetota bacterium]MSW04685.1 glutamate racemase [Actinomycetota bacterium]
MTNAAPLDTRPIGVFDSGLGGLTVLRSLIDLVPSESLIYFGDTGRFPYGPKPAEEVRGYALEISDLLVERGVKMLVVACNSAASAALEDLKSRYEIPVIGVVSPGVRAAAKVTTSRRVGVIGTSGTISSGAYQRAAEASELELTCQACPGFVEFVEAGDVDSDQVLILAERLLEPIRNANVDTLVLGCTHYPLLARTIAKVMGQGVTLISSADETAFEVMALLAVDGIATGLEPELGAAPEPRGSHTFITSGDTATFMELGARFLGPEVADVEAHRWG